MQQLEQWIRSVLEDHQCTLYEIEWLTNEKPPLLRVSIEKNDGTIDLDTCAEVSDSLSTFLDEKNWYEKEYMLEVCSPGAERELKTEDQLIHAIGKYVYVKFKNPKQGLDQVFGDLTQVQEDYVTVTYKEKTRSKTIDIDKDNIELIMTAVKV